MPGFMQRQTDMRAKAIRKLQQKKKDGKRKTDLKDKGKAHR